MAKPKLAMIPSTVGGSVYSVLPSNGDGDFDFSRASAATRINAQGLIETVAVGDNRLNYPLLDGTVQTCPHLLLEPQRTNLITYSEDFSNAAWTKENTTVSSNSIISPNGNLNGSLITSTSASFSDILQSTSEVASSNYVLSSYAKKGSSKWFFLRLTFATSAPYVWFNLDDGTIGTIGSGLTAKIENTGNGWYRCSISGVASASPPASRVDIGVSNSDGSQVPIIGNSVYIYGAQLELGSYLTSYIVSNSGSATTRLAEVCDGSGNASTFNSSEGVLMAQIGALANDGTYRLMALAKDTYNTIFIGYSPTSNQIVGVIYVGGVLQVNMAYTVTDATNFRKVAIKYALNDFALWIDGVEVDTDNSGPVFPAATLDEIQFDDGGGSNVFYGNTKQLQYFDSALTDSELETLTSWMSFSDMAIDLNYTIQ